MSWVGLGLLLAVGPTQDSLNNERKAAVVDTPAMRIALPKLRVVGRSWALIQEGIEAHRKYAYSEWARWIAKRWQGIPYGSGGAGLGPEELLINLEQMDCMTAIENFLALHIAHRKGLESPEGVAQTLMYVRYETPFPCRWEDRHHYLTRAFVAWEEEKWGCWLPLGCPDTRPIHYISKHPEKYRGFRDWRAIQKVERSLSARPRYYIPTENVGDWLSSLRDGDIVAFISNEAGLDVSHVGIFFWEEGRATFSHASLKARKWVYGEDLCAYLDKRSSKIQGITIFRPFP
ncbi:MAG: DUF1460 domain-containing protein [Bacteroidia bacterium]|nr:DUF1460 domain-containing protein [Bacteroidia bacterium]MDW8135118.1 DUF1460 domain-containing protein [Bacteroidia bacterium]